ncbi:hypothetical protein D3C75_394560 [compost metagenome]
MLAGAGLELAEQVLQMPFHGFFTDIQRQGDLLVRQVTCEQLQDFAFLGCQQPAGRHRAGRQWRRRGGWCALRSGRGYLVPDLAQPFEQLRVGVFDNPPQAVFLGQADRFTQAGQAVAARLVERQCLEQFDLHDFTAATNALGCFTGTLQQFQHPLPVTLHMGDIGLGQHHHQGQFRPEQACLFMRDLRHLGIEPAPQCQAGIGPALQRVQANLLGQGGNAETRNAALFTEHEQRLEQVITTMALALQDRQARGGDKTQYNRIRRSQALDHVQTVGQDRGGFLQLIALEQHCSQSAGQHHRHRTASANVLFGASQAVAQRSFGRHEATFADIAEAHHPFAKTADGVQA